MSILVLILSLIFLSFIGLLAHKRHLLIIIICFELLLLSCSLMFLAIANYHNDMTGMLFAFYILTIAAAEAAIGLAIFIAYFKTTGTILLEDNFMLKM